MAGKFMQIYGNLFEQTNSLEKSSTPTGLVWNINMAAVCFFWNINIATVTSCENTLFFHFPDCPSYKTFWKEKRAEYLNLSVHFIL